VYQAESTQTVIGSGSYSIVGGKSMELNQAVSPDILAETV
jgi:hypothetical protein